MIDRAHCIGYRSVGKTRPIVAKLVRTKDKELIKHASEVADLRSSDFRAADQFPQEVHVLARRKELIPKMADARKNGNKAVLVRDKLKINNKLVEQGIGEVFELSVISWNVQGLSTYIDDSDYLNVVSDFDLICAVRHGKERKTNTILMVIIVLTWVDLKV